jgi:hypothetical protein
MRLMRLSLYASVHSVNLVCVCYPAKKVGMHFFRPLIANLHFLSSVRYSKSAKLLGVSIFKMQICIFFINSQIANPNLITCASPLIVNPHIFRHKKRDDDLLKIRLLFDPFMAKLPKIRSHLCLADFILFSIRI